MSPEPARAEAVLLADRGMVATDTGEFFRCAEFLRAEGVTHSLVVRDRDSALALPLLVRDIDGGGQDAISPYGFPGGSLRGNPLDPSRIDFSATGLVSVFVRDRVNAPVFVGGTRRNRILLHDPGRPRTIRSTFRYQARRNEKRGYSTQVLYGPEVADEVRRAFGRAYAQTMRRADAGDRYFFTDEYFEACLTSERAWLAVVHGPDGDLAAGSIAVLSDGTLHYYLGSTSDEHRHASPAKNAFVHLLDVADAWKVPLNFGGGMRPADGLEHFKEGFTNAEAHLLTHEIVCDADRYEKLSAHIDGAPGFFPAYRS